MKVLAQASQYQCGECAEPLMFEPIKLSETNCTAIGACQNVDRFSNITGELLRKGCSRVGIRLQIPVEIMECQVVP